MSFVQALRGNLASLVPDSRISLCELSTKRWLPKISQCRKKFILLLLIVKTQIFAILDNLAHLKLLQTQSNVVTLRAAKLMLACTMLLEIWILRIAETYGGGRGIDFHHLGSDFGIPF